MQSTLEEFRETESQEAFSLQNGKLLKVELDQVTIQAKLGSMVAYQGDVRFEHAGSGGMGRMLKKAVSGEGTRLMKMEGSGEVFLADQAQDIHLIKLENEQVTCNGANVLAFDAGIDWDIKKVEGGASSMLAGTLKAVVSQRLVKRADAQGRAACCEVLRMTGRVRDMIMNPEETGKLCDVIAEGAYYGMQTFDQALLAHVQAGRVTMEEAVRAATSPHDFKLMVASDGQRSTSVEQLMAEPVEAESAA